MNNANETVLDEPLPPTQRGTKKRQLLLVEDSDSDALILSALLKKTALQRYQITRAQTLQEAIAAIGCQRFEIALLDLGLPDSGGLETFSVLSEHADFPIIVNSGMSDEELALEAVHLGAQDYLMKDELNAHQLERSMRYAIERHGLLKELEDAKEASESANRAKSAFLAVMSHEFRTPMNGIVGALNLLDDSEIPPASRELLAIMRDCADSQLALINDVLDISKIEAGKMEVNLEAFILHDLMRSVTSSLSLKANSKGIELTCEIDPSTPVHIIADHNRLRQVLVNLIGNAIKFTDQGHVATTIDRVDTNELRFTVRDTGVGIDPNKIDTIFDAFTQVDSSYTRRFQGSGLGLAISKRIVNLLGGEISVKSEPGAGSEFAFTLPFERAKLASDPTHPERAEQNSENFLLGDQYPLSILVVDDNDTSRKLMQRALKKMGYAAATAPDGREGIRLARERPFDLVFMDLQMPDLDGVKATREIRRNASSPETQPQIIAMTACATEYDRAVCLEAGMDSFLSKPVEIEDLRGILTTVHAKLKTIRAS